MQVARESSLGISTKVYMIFKDFSSCSVLFPAEFQGKRSTKKRERCLLFQLLQHLKKRGRCVSINLITANLILTATSFDVHSASNLYGENRVYQAENRITEAKFIATHLFADQNKDLIMMLDSVFS